jgi:hypothetical protein
MPLGGMGGGEQPAGRAPGHAGASLTISQGSLSFAPFAATFSSLRWVGGAACRCSAGWGFAPLFRPRPCRFFCCQCPGILSWAPMLSISLQNLQSDCPFYRYNLNHARQNVVFIAPVTGYLFRANVCTLLAEGLSGAGCRVLAFEVTGSCVSASVKVPSCCRLKPWNL